MKISTRGRYGLRILLDLALFDSEKPRLIRDIAQSQKISEKYVSRLIIDLRRAGMVRSIRGAKGGFKIFKKPAEITLLDVVEVMEGPLSIVGCVALPEKCTSSTLCSTRQLWDKVNSDIRESLRKFTLQDVMDCHNRQNVQKGIIDYCI